ncbi:EAL domain-containing protein [Pacificispira sp.]|uniref:EAL domain-containing protein n=1 Tax=Pacificispira sp. TaxID=2888761 RepID=UPI003BAC6003
MSGQDGDSEAERRTFQLYIDESGRIAMARGNADRWLGTGLTDLEGRSVAEFAAEESQFAISEILVQAALREFLPKSLFFMRETRTGSVSGFEVTGKPQTFNELYRLNFVQDPDMEYGPQSKNSREGFVGAVERAIRDAAENDRDVDMTFLDIGDVGRLGSIPGLSPEDVRRFTDRVESRLKAESVGGDSLGRVDRGKYGLVHDRNADMSILRSEIESYAKDVDPGGQALRVDASTVMLDADSMDVGDVRTALEHAVDEFADTGIDAVIFDTLADSQASYLDRKETRTALLMRCLDDDVLTCAFAPVCDIAKWTTHHLTSEFRANLDDDGLGAAEILKLTDGDDKLRTQVDSAQCRYILTHEALDAVGVSVNVAIRSLLEPEVIGMLLDFRRKAPQRMVILRLSGLDKIPWEKVQALDILRRAGFAIALYGRDVGAVTAEKLEAIPADYILLDPSFVVNLDQLKRGLPMMANMVSRCREYGIRIVFEGVLESAGARLLSKIEGALCNGPYFGEPVESLDQLKLPVQGG